MRMRSQRRRHAVRRSWRFRWTFSASTFRFCRVPRARVRARPRRRRRLSMTCRLDCRGAPAGFRRRRRSGDERCGSRCGRIGRAARCDRVVRTRAVVPTGGHALAELLRRTDAGTRRWRMPISYSTSGSTRSNANIRRYSRKGAQSVTSTSAPTRRRSTKRSRTTPSIVGNIPATIERFSGSAGTRASAPGRRTRYLEGGARPTLSRLRTTSCR